MRSIIDKDEEYIVFLGENGFPHGLAAIQRMTLISKALLNDGFRVIIICRKGVIKRSSKLNFEAEGSYQGIDYIYVSGEIFRPKGFLNRNFAKIKGMIDEFKYLYNLKRKGNITAAIISNHSAVHVFRYRLVSWILGFPIVLNFVELASSMQHRKGFVTNVNDYVFDNFIVKIVDGALPISNKLMDYYNEKSPLKPKLKLPILCDFDKFNINLKSDSEIIFLYCGAVSYIELIRFVIKSFDELRDLPDNVFLHLILGGDESGLQAVQNIVEKSINSKKIQVITNVPHNKIPRHYSNATALLIPLRPTVQDAARFPHKIGEYLASERPIITTAYGEINNYDFIDEDTALVAKEYDTTLFSEKMKFVLDNPSKAIEIGIKGREMGLRNFDYSKFGKILRSYFKRFIR